MDFKDPIAQSTPHLYLSALPFAPQHCQFTQKFLGSYPRTITVTTGKPDYWPSSLFVSYHQKWEIWDIAFSRDPRHFASSSNCIYICNAENGNIISGPLHNDPETRLGLVITSIAFHPDGHRLVSGSWDGEVEVFDVKSGDQLLRLHGYGGVLCVAYSNDGQMIAARLEDGIIRIWDVASGRGIGDIIKSQGPGYFSKIVFSADDKHIISFDGSVEIWDIHSGICDKRWSPPGLLALSAGALSPDGQFVADGSFNGTVRVWNTKTGDLVTNPLEGHTGEIISLAYSPDGKRLASVSQGEAVRVWDPFQGQMVFGPLSVYSLHTSTVALSTDGTKLALASTDGTLRMWDLDDVGLSPLSGPADLSDVRNQGERVPSPQAEEGNPAFPALPEKVLRIVFSPCGKKLASISLSGIRIWDTNTGELLLGPINPGVVAAFAFSPDGRWIASLSDNTTIYLWDVTVGNLVRQSLELGGDPDSEWRWLAFVPNSKNLVSCANNRVCIWDVETMSISHGAVSRPIAFASNGIKVIQMDSEGQIQMWSTETQKPITAHFPDPACWSHQAVFSPSGKLVCFIQPGVLKFWDIEIGKEVTTVSLDPVCLVFSSDDRFIAMQFSDGLIGVFDIVHSSICGTWEGFTYYASDIAFSPDGKRLASSVEGGTIRIWDTSNFVNSSPSHSPLEPHNPYTDKCRLEGGWMKTANGELLFWVPPSNRYGLWRPRNTAMIAKVSTKLDLTKFEYGNNWQNCRDGR